MTLDPDKIAAELRYAAQEANAIESRSAEVRPAHVLAFLDERAALSARVKELEAALTPFSHVGKIIDGPFGPALFAESDQAFRDGCAWTENGEKRTLTWGDFRRAGAALFRKETTR